VGVPILFTPFTRNCSFWNKLITSQEIYFLCCDQLITIAHLAMLPNLQNENNDSLDKKNLNSAFKLNHLAALHYILSKNQF
jgi:hypothetical protein